MNLNKHWKFVAFLSHWLQVVNHTRYTAEHVLQKLLDLLSDESGGEQRRVFG